MSKLFSERKTVEQVEEGNELAPKFDSQNLIPVVTTDAGTGEVLMLGYMNPEAFELTITTGEAHYYSRSREIVWHKGATSGLVQKIVDLRIDDDQDSVWLVVEVGGNGASCHVGYRSCFYRSVPFGEVVKSDSPLKLKFEESEKVFDPQEVYGDAPNPTKL
jgi:phosphoribosyl-AMP cyclohydrolase